MIKLERPLVFFDLETTGVDVSKDRIVQFAAAKYNDLCQDPIEEMNELIKPEIPIPAQASEVHGIYEKDLLFKPNFSHMASKIFSFMNGCDFAGHNIARFDVPLLYRQLDECRMSFSHDPKFVDTYQVVKEQFPHTLCGAYKMLTGDELVDAHDALADVLASKRVLQYSAISHAGGNVLTAKILHDRYRDPDQLDLCGKLKIKDDNIVLTFGKHKDVPIGRVPQSYFNWAIQNNVFMKDALTIIKKELEGGY